MLKRKHRTKIVATLGPSTSTDEAIENLFTAGVDVFRLNFSHGAHEGHRTRYNTIRDLENRMGRPIAIMMDLQGPKLRVGVFEDGPVMLEKGAKFRLDMKDEPGNKDRVTLPHPEIFQALEPETDLLLDDGNLRLRVTACGPEHADTVVVVGGKLSERKGVNVPGVVLPLSPLTEKDRKDLAFGLELGADWVALSFVQRPEDIREARELVGSRAGILAKLEKPAAIEKLEEIVELADAVMVARGDLGVEMPAEDVPVIQRRIIQVCREYGKPVVVATQMLDSMMERPVPTRAEASDVANAVYEGADAVMLSGETAAGKYPMEAVTIMNRIIERVQDDPQYVTNLESQRREPEDTTPDAISTAVSAVSAAISPAAIITYTTSGSTAYRIARERPDYPIISLTPKVETARRLAIVWGVHSARTPDAYNLDDMVDIATHQARIDGFAQPDDRVVITAGIPFGSPGKTNMLRIARITAGS